VLEFLDLHEGWVREGSKKSEGFINSFDGSIVFSNTSFESFNLLSSKEVDFSKSFSVLGLVFLEFGNSVSKLSSSWFK
jgi:hypothetical protein